MADTVRHAHGRPGLGRGPAGQSLPRRLAGRAAPGLNSNQFHADTLSARDGTGAERLNWVVFTPKALHSTAQSRAAHPIGIKLTISHVSILLCRCAILGCGVKPLRGMAFLVSNLSVSCTNRSHLGGAAPSGYRTESTDKIGSYRPVPPQQQRCRLCRDDQQLPPPLKSVSTHQQACPPASIFGSSGSSVLWSGKSGHGLHS